MGRSCIGVIDTGRLQIPCLTIAAAMPELSETVFLAWDSDFLGIKVGRLTAPLEGSPVDRIAAAQADGYHLLYADIPEPDQAETVLDFAGQQPITHRCLLEKALTASASGTLSHVRRLAGDIEIGTLEDLRDLSVQAGWTSRFKVDRKIADAMFLKLYHQWTDKSLTGELADVVLATYADERISGFVTVTCKPESLAEIGLFAVDKKFRRQGLGGRLLAAAEAFAVSRGRSRMRVSTQGENGGAIATYVAAGYRVIERSRVYHIWL